MTIRKTLFTLFLTTLLLQSLPAQIPAGYYDSANGLTGSALKTALHRIIRNHTKRSYDQLWTDFETTDMTSTGKVWDMYSNCTWTFGTDQCGSYSSECDCYNREHSMPNSWWGGSTDTMYSDLFHLVPTDGKVNGMRSNYPFGTVSSPTYTSGNGSKLGPCSFSGYTGTVFEPIDTYKGDFARNYFYLATRYETRIASWSSDMLAGNSYPVFTTWALNLLYQWHTQDPVSQKEIDRNNAIYGIQHNRNPYIDHPEWVAVVWNFPTSVAENHPADQVEIYPNPASGLLHINLPSGNPFNHAYVTDVTGRSILSLNGLTGKQDLDIQSLDQGYYFLVLEGRDIKVTKGFIKQ